MSSAPAGRRRLAVLVMSLLALCSAASTAADKGDSRAFLGVWQGNDPLDGGFITLEITRHAGDPDVLDLRFSDTFIRACTVEPIPNLPTGDSVDARRGIYLAFAQASGGNLLSTGNVSGAGRVTGGVQDIPGAPSDPTLSPAGARLIEVDRKSTRLNSSHVSESRMPSSA